MTSQKVLRICISLRVSLSNSVNFKVNNEYGNDARVESEGVFRPVYHVACRGVI